MNARPLVTDLALAQRLERTEARASAAFVESRALLHPAVRAAWRDVAGTYAMFDGVDSPLTQTFGLGLFSAPTPETLEELETFFTSRGADVHHEVCPLADGSLLRLLPERSYVPVEQSSVLYRSLAAAAPAWPSGAEPAPFRTRRVGLEEADRWANASAAGWGESPELADFMRNFGRVSAMSRGLSAFVAEVDGVVAATGALAIHDGVALLAGASTIPAFRNRGAQNALLAARLAFAIDQGCDLAMICAAPGSTSQCNAQRQGFSVAYTRTKWKLVG